ncbi:MarR family winged helix-turn-helix transcriptional regulator [Sphingobium cloacae]|nr:MarR family transcriptional regulator [Sphingobium cloacae]
MTQTGQSGTQSSEYHDPLSNIETRIWLRLLTLQGTIYARLNRIFLDQFGISIAKFDVLAQLHRFGDNLSQGELSERLKVTGGNVTGLVRRLVADGLITREMSASDRRSFVVSLTPKGRAVFEAARDMHDALLRDWFGGLSPDDLKSALDILNLLSSETQAKIR